MFKLGSIDKIMKKNIKNVINTITKLDATRLVLTINNIYIRLMVTTSNTPSINSRSREYTIGVTE